MEWIERMLGLVSGLDMFDRLEFNQGYYKGVSLLWKLANKTKDFDFVNSLKFCFIVECVCGDKAYQILIKVKDYTYYK